jgi:hypothetical protein
MQREKAEGMCKEEHQGKKVEKRLTDEERNKRRDGVEEATNEKYIRV